MGHKTIRVDEDIFKKVQEASILHSRSLGGQVAHWINIGRVMEKSPSMDMDRIEAALKAELMIDNLTPEETEIYLDKFFASMGEETAEEAQFYADIARKGKALGFIEE